VPTWPRGAQAKPKRPEWRDALMLSIPTGFDLIATVLMNIGLLTVTASVYQMMRGAEMLFAAVFAILFLHRSLNKLHYSGIGCCIAGITLVGLSSVLSGQGGTAVAVTQGQILLGMTLIVMSQAVQAAQVTFEDYFMSELAISPMKIVGYEGVIGAMAMIYFVLPIVRLLPGARPLLLLLIRHQVSALSTPSVRILCTLCIAHTMLSAKHVVTDMEHCFLTHEGCKPSG
jgi:drug/metabolite transporter (DMT)-like permease